MIECQHCRRDISSFLLDEHEAGCTERLSVLEMRRLNEIPATKIESSEINQIGVQSSDMDDSSSIDGSPARNKVLHAVESINTEIRKKEDSSPFLLKGMLKTKSTGLPSNRAHYNSKG